MFFRGRYGPTRVAEMLLFYHGPTLSPSVSGARRNALLTKQTLLRRVVSWSPPLEAGRRPSRFTTRPPQIRKSEAVSISVYALISTTSRRPSTGQVYDFKLKSDKEIKVSELFHPTSVCFPFSSLLPCAVFIAHTLSIFLRYGETIRRWTDRRSREVQWSSPVIILSSFCVPFFI